MERGRQMLTTWRNSKPESLAEISEEMIVRKTNEIFVLFSLGSQFDHLIKQQLDKLGVFCLVADPASIMWGDVYRFKRNLKGIILLGVRLQSMNSLRRLTPKSSTWVSLCWVFVLDSSYGPSTSAPRSGRQKNASSEFMS